MTRDSDVQRAETARTKSVPPCRELHVNSGDRRRAELTALLMERKVPGKNEIMRAKALIRDLAARRDGRGPRPDDVQEFISAYFDLYLARVVGDTAIERAGLERCLGYLGRRRAA